MDIDPFYQHTSSEVGQFCAHPSRAVAHSYFEDATNAAFSEETRWEIDDIYNTILITYDNDEDDCFQCNPSLRTAFLKTGGNVKAAEAILLEMRKVYHRRVWQLVENQAFYDALDKTISDYDRRCFETLARAMVTEGVLEQITLSKFGNSIDNYNIKDCSIKYIVNDLIKTL